MGRTNLQRGHNSLIRAMAAVHEFNVKMTCGGCSGAVTKALTKLDGVSMFL